MAYELTKVVKTLRFPGDNTNQYQINAVRLGKWTADSIEERFSTLESFDALRYMGTLAAGATLPAANKGDVYKIISAGTIAGAKVEIGDMLICNTDNTAAGTAANWDIIQGNIDVDAILDHTHTGNVSLNKTSKTLQHTVTPTQANLTATFTNGAASVTGNHTHTASGSVTITPGGSVESTSITPAGTVKLTSPTTAGTNDVTVTPSGTVANSTERFVTGVTVSGHAAHSHTGTTELKGASVSGSVTISTGTGTANYTPAGTIGNNNTAVTNVEAGSITIDEHEASSGSAGGFTPAGTVTVNSYTPEGSVSSHKHDVSVNAPTATHSSIAAITTTYTAGDTNYDGVLTIGTTTNSATYVKSVTVSETEKAPTFTGTAKAPTATFAGTPVSGHTHTITVEDHEAVVPSLTLTRGNHTHSFTGTGVELTASHSLTAASHSHGFTTSSETVGAHTVTAPTAVHDHDFTGNALNIHAAFTGTAASHNHTFTGTGATHDVSVSVNNYEGTFTGTASGTVTPSVSKVLTGVTIGEHKIDTVDSATVTTGRGTQN